jgi:ATP-dependent protease Clp ATPase subunit
MPEDLTTRIHDTIDKTTLKASDPDVSFQLIQEFLIRIASKNYKDALTLSNEILILEPDNQLIQEYQSVLKERLIQLEQESSGEEESSDEESSEDDDSKISSSASSSDNESS